MYNLLIFVYIYWMNVKVPNLCVPQNLLHGGLNDLHCIMKMYTHISYIVHWIMPF